MKKGFIGLISGIVGATAGAVAIGFFSGKTIEQKSGKIDKFKGYYYTLNQWLILKQEGKSLDKYFKANGYSTIAIYGMGEMGNRLYDELKNSEITVRYAIDKNADNTYAELEIVGMDDEWEKVDVIIVTAMFAFDSIEESLQKKVDYPIISLEDVVYEI